MMNGLLRCWWFYLVVAVFSVGVSVLEVRFGDQAVRDWSLILFVASLVASPFLRRSHIEKISRVRSTLGWMFLASLSCFTWATPLFFGGECLDVFTAWHQTLSIAPYLLIGLTLNVLLMIPVFGGPILLLWALAGLVVPAKVFDGSAEETAFARRAAFSLNPVGLPIWVIRRSWTLMVRTVRTAVFA